MPNQRGNTRRLRRRGLWRLKKSKKQQQSPVEEHRASSIGADKDCNSFNSEEDRVEIIMSPESSTVETVLSRDLLLNFSRPLSISSPSLHSKSVQKHLTPPLSSPDDSTDEATVIEMILGDEDNDNHDGQSLHFDHHSVMSNNIIYNMDCSVASSDALTSAESNECRMQKEDTRRCVEHLCEEETKQQCSETFGSQYSQCIVTAVGAEYLRHNAAEESKNNSPADDNGSVQYSPCLIQYEKIIESNIRTTGICLIGSGGDEREQKPQGEQGQQGLASSFPLLGIRSPLKPPSFPPPSLSIAVCRQGMSCMGLEDDDGFSEDDIYTMDSGSTLAGSTSTGTKTTFQTNASSTGKGGKGNPNSSANQCKSFMMKCGDESILDVHQSYTIIGDDDDSDADSGILNNITPAQKRLRLRQKRASQIKPQLSPIPENFTTTAAGEVSSVDGVFEEQQSRIDASTIQSVLSYDSDDDDDESSSNDDGEKREKKTIPVVLRPITADKEIKIDQEEDRENNDVLDNDSNDKKNEDDNDREGFSNNTVTGIGSELNNTKSNFDSGKGCTSANKVSSHATSTRNSQNFLEGIVNEIIEQDNRNQPSTSCLSNENIEFHHNPMMMEMQAIADNEFEDQEEEDLIIVSIEPIKPAQTVEQQERDATPNTSPDNSDDENDEDSDSLWSGLLEDEDESLLREEEGRVIIAEPNQHRKLQNNEHGKNSRFQQEDHGKNYYSNNEYNGDEGDDSPEMVVKEAGHDSNGAACIISGSNDGATPGDVCRSIQTTKSNCSSQGDDTNTDDDELSWLSYIINGPVSNKKIQTGRQNNVVRPPLQQKQIHQQSQEQHQHQPPFGNGGVREAIHAIEHTLSQDKSILNNKSKNGPHASDSTFSWISSTTSNYSTSAGSADYNSMLDKTTPTSSPNHWMRQNTPDRKNKYDDDRDKTPKRLNVTKAVIVTKARKVAAANRRKEKERQSIVRNGENFISNNRMFEA